MDFQTIIGGLGAVVLALSCATTPEVPAGRSTVNADGGKEALRGVRSSRIVALNGTRLESARRSLVINPGDTRLTVRFDARNGRSYETELRFHARSDRLYTIAYDPMPPLQPGGDLTSDYFGALFNQDEFRDSAGGGPGALAVFGVIGAGIAASPAVVAADAASQTGRNDTLLHVDLIVLSSHPREGVVAKQRIDAAGRVVSSWREGD